jgi:hypothetical protein
MNNRFDLRTEHTHGFFFSNPKQCRAFEGASDAEGGVKLPDSAPSDKVGGSGHIPRLDEIAPGALEPHSGSSGADADRQMAEGKSRASAGNNIAIRSLIESARSGPATRSISAIISLDARSIDSRSFASRNASRNFSASTLSRRANMRSQMSKRNMRVVASDLLPSKESADTAGAGAGAVAVVAGFEGGGACCCRAEAMNTPVRTEKVPVLLGLNPRPTASTFSR